MPLKLNGSTSGYVIVDAPAVAGTNTLTLPAVTDTVTTNAATQTLSNKTLSSPTITGTATSTGDISTTGTVVMGSSFLRNRIINGGMQIWQRGTSFSSPANGAYTADRWFGSGASISSISQSADVPTGYKYSISASGTAYTAVGQRIESVNCIDLGGATVTLSFWLKQTTAAGTGAIAVALYYANTADTFSSTTQIGSNQYINTSSTWTQYTITFSSISANAVNGLQILFIANNAGSSAYQITGVQLEVGSVATPFERRQYGQELELCQRYYQQINGPSSNNAYMAAGTQAGSTTSWSAYFNFIATMRAAPTFTFSGLSITDGYSFGTGVTGITNFWPTTYGARVDGTNSGAGAANRMTFFYMTSGNYVAYNAEL
jgi:hypothetical protein